MAFLKDLSTKLTRTDWQRDFLFVTFCFIISAIAGIAIGLILNIFISLKGMSFIIYIICFGGYPAFFFGFMGGMIYLIRTEE